MRPISKISMNINEIKSLISNIRNLNNKKIISHYTIFGIIFGLSFPVIAYFLQSQPNILFYVICTAPLFLGIFSAIAGTQRAFYENENTYTKQIKNLLNEKNENESKYTNVVNSMAEGLVVQDSNGRIIQFNPSACEILNLTPDELMGRTSVDPRWQAIREDGTPFEGADHPAMVALRTNDKIRNVTMGLNLPNGTTNWIRINAVPFETTTGRNVLTTFSDISSIVKFENENKLLFDLNSAILKSSKFIIITTSLDGYITGFNEQAENYLGYKANEVINKLQYTQLYEPNELVKLSNELSIQFNTNIPSGFEALIYKALHGISDEKKSTYLSHDGTKMNVRVNITALYDNREAKLTGYLIIAKDINDELKSQELLETEKVKSLHNAKLASLGEMAAGIAHEINNPLAIIAGNIGLLRKFKDDQEKYKSKEDTILKSIDRITKIVNGLRKFSRTTSEENRKPESIQTIIDESLSIIEPKMKRNSVEIINNLNTKSIIFCDSVEIEQVFVNLISNAIDAIQTFTEKWVRIEGIETESTITIKVIDSGKGIPLSVEEKIFQPFFTTKEVGKGTGLGLSITKGILDNHNAKIQICKDETNTCFAVTFKKVIEKKLAA